MEQSQVTKMVKVALIEMYTIYGRCMNKKNKKCVA